jgi:hypothetical protein
VPSAPPAPTRPGPLDVLGVPGQINLDHAASAPCARAAADAVAELLPWYASVHRGAGALSRRCTREYELARETIGDFFGARADDHVVFTRNTTDALNLLARALPASDGGDLRRWSTTPTCSWPVGTVRLPVPEWTRWARSVLDAALASCAAEPTRPGRCWSR